MLRKLAIRLSAQITWWRAYNISAAGEHQRALEIIRQNKWWRETPFLHLLGVFQLAHLGLHDEVLSESNALIATLQTRPRNLANRKYLLAFVKWLRFRAASALHPLDWKPQWHEPDVTTFPLADVSSTWKRAFPLPIHPEWKDSFD